MPRKNIVTVDLRNRKEKTSKPIFISHNTADKEIVELFVNLLINTELASRKDIVCTSLDGMKIPDGRDLKPYLKAAIDEQRLFIAVATDSYFERPMCMAELGAVYFSGGDVFPLLFPPSTHRDMKGVLEGIIARPIDDDVLDDLKDRVERVVHSRIQTSPWNKAKREFVAAVKEYQDRKLEAAAKVGAAAVSTVARMEATPQKLFGTGPSALFQAIGEVAETASLARDLVTTDPVTAMANVARRGRRAKPKKPKPTVPETVSATVALFKAKCKEIGALLMNLPAIARVSVIKDRNTDYDWRPIDDGFSISEIRTAEESGYISVNDDGRAFMNSDNKKLAKIRSLLWELSVFIEQLPTDVEEKLDELSEANLEAYNRDFWKEWFHRSVFNH